jgi:6-phosphogluconolactonase (cycloisomerase 2 family)
MTTRRFTLNALGLAFALGLSPALYAHQDDDDDGFRSGKVFTSSNGTAGNELLVYDTAQDGALSLAQRLATQGVGTGGGLGNQGAVTLSADGRHLFVVNAGSNTVSTWRGLRPISVAEHEGLVYVLNADGAGNVAGFRNRRGTLEAVAGGVQPLSAAGGTGPAQVGFGDDGRVLVVTEKATNKLTTYRVRLDGSIDAPRVTPSVGTTPFGFAVDRRGDVLVSEAFGGAAGASALSSYTFAAAASSAPLAVVSASVADTQSAACWVVVTPNGRHAYTTNTGSNTVSRFSVDAASRLALSQAVAATTDSGPIDAAIPPRGRMLFVLNAGGRSVQSYAIGRDGELSGGGRAIGLPAGATGLAAN